VSPVQCVYSRKKLQREGVIGKPGRKRTKSTGLLSNGSLTSSGRSTPNLRESPPARNRQSSSPSRLLRDQLQSRLLLEDDASSTTGPESLQNSNFQDIESLFENEDEIEKASTNSNFLHLLFSGAEVSWDDSMLDQIQSSPTQLYNLLIQPNGQGHSAFSTSVYYGNHEKALDLLSLIPDAFHRRNILLATYPPTQSNFLHAAAARGNSDFLKRWLEEWESWGLTQSDIVCLLNAKENRHDQTPFGMAEYQVKECGQDHSQVMNILISALTHV
jgi:hypothetical protein